MRTWVTDLKRAFRSWGFAVGTVGAAVCIVAGCFPDLLSLWKEKTTIYAGYAADTCLQALSGKLFLSVLPILCALPYTASCMEEVKSRFVRFAVSRSGRKVYDASKIGACALTGGSVALAGIAVGTTVLLLLVMPLEEPWPEAEEVFVMLQQTLVGLFGRMLLFFLAGSLWALIGLAASLGTGSTYMAYAFPFIFYYFLLILTTRYLPSLYALCPDQWTNPGSEWGAGILGAALLMGELSVLVGLICMLLVERKLRNV